MPSSGSYSDSDRTCVINAGMERTSGSIDSCSRDVAHEFDGHVGTFTCIWYALVKNGSNAGPKNPEFVLQ